MQGLGVLLQTMALWRHGVPRYCFRRQSARAGLHGDDIIHASNVKAWHKDGSDKNMLQPQ